MARQGRMPLSVEDHGIRDSSMRNRESSGELVVSSVAGTQAGSEEG